MSSRRSGPPSTPFHPKRVLPLGFFALSLMLSFDALGQGLDIQQFHPMPDQGRNFFSTSSAEVAPHLYWQASTLAHYAHNPLVLRDRDGTRLSALVGSQASVNLLATL